MTACPLYVYEPNDDHVVATRRAATILRLVPALPTVPIGHPVVEFVPDPRAFRAWERHTVAPVRYAACLAVYAHRIAVNVPVGATVAAVSLVDDQILSFSHQHVAVPALPAVTQIEAESPAVDTRAVSPAVDTSVERTVGIDLAEMDVMLHAPELPLIERKLDVVAYTRSVVYSVFAEVGATA